MNEPTRRLVMDEQRDGAEGRTCATCGRDSFPSCWCFPFPSQDARCAHMTSTPRHTFTETVPAHALTRYRNNVRALGGRIVSSAPVAAGYAVTASLPVADV